MFLNIFFFSFADILNNATFSLDGDEEGIDETISTVPSLHNSPIPQAQDMSQDAGSADSEVAGPSSTPMMSTIPPSESSSESDQTPKKAVRTPRHACSKVRGRGRGIGRRGRGRRCGHGRGSIAAVQSNGDDWKDPVRPRRRFQFTLHTHVNIEH